MMARQQTQQHNVVVKNLLMNLTLNEYYSIQDMVKSNLVDLDALDESLVLASEDGQRIFSSILCGMTEEQLDFIESLVPKFLASIVDELYHQIFSNNNINNQFKNKDRVHKWLLKSGHAPVSFYYLDECIRLNNVDALYIYNDMEKYIPENHDLRKSKVVSEWLTHKSKSTNKIIYQYPHPHPQPSIAKWWRLRRHV